MMHASAMAGRGCADPEADPDPDHRQGRADRQVIRIDGRRQPFRDPDQQAFLDAGKDAGVQSGGQLSRGSRGSCP